MKAGNILVIDDDPDIGELVTAAAEAMGLRCSATTDASKSKLTQLVTPEVTLILLDLMMPQMDGIEVLRTLGGRKCTTSIVLMSGIGARVIETAEELARALNLNIVGHLKKPFDLTELESVLEGNAPPKIAKIDKRSPQIVISDQELRNALENHEFVLYYQPQIEIATGRVFGLEALARWQQPDRDLIYPDHFIGRIEALGLADDFCWLIVDRGLSEISQFADKNLDAPRLSLNVSVHSLRDLKFPDAFEAALKKYRVAPENVAIEITETGLIDELSLALDVLTRLRMKNIQLSIDDFGTGYAAMQQLHNVPATELKIDKSFVENMLTNASNRVMVQKIIEIGHELSMTVLAEGVETPQQLEFLRQKGCDHAQGYLFSCPLALSEVVPWLQMHRSRRRA